LEPALQDVGLDVVDIVVVALGGVGGKTFIANRIAQLQSEGK
jgi:hypothetical protein